MSHKGNKLQIDGEKRVLNTFCIRNTVGNLFLLLGKHKTLLVDVFVLLLQLIVLLSNFYRTVMKFDVFRFDFFVLAMQLTVKTFGLFIHYKKHY